MDRDPNLSATLRSMGVADYTQPLTPFERAAGVLPIERPAARQYRPLTDTSEEASGDDIVYADESEYTYEFYED